MVLIPMISSRQTKAVGRLASGIRIDFLTAAATSVLLPVVASGCVAISRKVNCAPYNSKANENRAYHHTAPKIFVWV